MDYKLIYDLKNNTYKFFDLKTDPMEKKDVQKSEPTAFTDMQEKLQAWIDRVVFDRDADTNQVLHKLDGILLDKAPTPQHPVEGVSFDGGRIEVMGYDVEGGEFAPGTKAAMSVYFRVKDRPSAPFKLQAQAFLGVKIARSSMRTTGAGFLPTNAWRAGDFIRDRFEIAIPTDWGTSGSPASVGLAMQGDQKVDFVGTTAANDPNVAILGDAAVRDDLHLDGGAPAPRGFSPGQ